MKPILLLFLAVMASVSPVLSQDGNPASPNTAYIPGDVPDGSPPPPEAPLPKFTVAPEDILASETHEQNGRKITTQRITPIELPAPAVAPPAALAGSINEQPDAHSGEQGRDFGFLMISATVFRSPDSPPRTLVNLTPQGTGGSATFWSSADFALFTGLASFIDSDGNSRSLMMGWDTQQIDHMSDLMVNQTDEGGPPQLPAIPAGKATFVIAGAAPTAETLAAIQALHDVYNNEYERLKTGYEGRERARIAKEAELKAHPPKPKDIILNYWRIPDAAVPAASAPAEGGAK